MTFDDLLKTIEREQLRVDRDLLRLAYETADKAHAGQKRHSGQPYISHALAVADKLALLHLDEETIIAGLLHDVPEDTAVTIDEIKKDFGKNIAALVAGVTKLGKLKYRGKGPVRDEVSSGVERYVENLRKMFVAMAKDIRVILIKFADRLHNLETLQYLPDPTKRLRIARESLEIFAPIANRLGMGEVKGQLEDLAFPYVKPDEYQRTKALREHKFGDIGGFVNELTALIRRELEGKQIAVGDVHGREKHLYSLYKKLQRPEIDGDIEKIYDLVALRVIVGSVADCYAALGIIHSLWRPLPGRIKDYIAQPKPNGYQSIHTTVFGPRGQIVEIQIRDKAMHAAAEFGIAAYWHYDENVKTKDKSYRRPIRLDWVRELTEWQQELEDEHQYLETLKIDVFQNRIFCFTPKGDVIDLPEGASAVDFAYAVHTELGNQMTGTRVNGKFESVTTGLKSGDVVEVITDKNRTRPSTDWLPHVKTHAARAKMRHALREQR